MWSLQESFISCPSCALIQWLVAEQRVICTKVYKFDLNHKIFIECIPRSLSSCDHYKKVSSAVPLLHWYNGLFNIWSSPCHKRWLRSRTRRLIRPTTQKNISFNVYDFFASLNFEVAWIFAEQRVLYIPRCTNLLQGLIQTTMIVSQDHCSAVIAKVMPLSLQSALRETCLWCEGPHVTNDSYYSSLSELSAMEKADSDLLHQYFHDTRSLTLDLNPKLAASHLICLWFELV